MNSSPSTRKKDKKSFWFEYAEKKGEDPHKSAWRKFEEDGKEKQKGSIRYCRKCGSELILDAKFCERCGQRLRSK